MLWLCLEAFVRRRRFNGAVPASTGGALLVPAALLACGGGVAGPSACASEHGLPTPSLHGDGCRAFARALNCNPAH